MDDVRVCLVGRGARRADIEAAFATVGTADRVPSVRTDEWDCLVGIPADGPAEMAQRLEASPLPGVLLCEQGADAGGIPDGVDVVRDGEGAERVLAGRVRAAVAAGERAAPDGGASAADHTETPLERMSDGVVTLGEEWAVTYLNGAAAETLGVDAERAVGRQLGDVTGGESVFGRAAEEAVEAGEPTTVEEYSEPLEAWFEVRAYPDEEGVSLFFRDVTEHRRAREELEASESALEELHETVSDTTLDASAKLERILDVGRKRLAVDVGMLTDMDDETWRVEAVAGDHPAIEPGVSLPVSETICRRVVGSEEPLGVTDVDESWPEGARDIGVGCYLGTELRVDGEPYGTLCFVDTASRERGFTESEEAFVEVLADWVRYVLERESYEEELRERRRQLETVTEHVPVVLFAFDTEGTFTLARGRGLDALGFEPGEPVGESVFEVYGDHPDVVDHVERALDGEHGHHTVELESGTVLELWYQPVVEDGEVTQVVGVARDITESERTQARLERERAFVESILSSLPDPLYAFDEEGTLVRWNDRVATVTGYDDDELAGMDAREFVAAADRERIDEMLERVADGERVSIEADVETKAGDHLPYELSGAPIAEDGEVVGATGVARDVSDQQAQREMLSGLLEATGSLMQARDREEVAEVAVNAAESVLGFDINLVRLYDREAGTLVPAARTERMATEMGERPVYEVGEGNPGEVFASGEPLVVDDVADGGVTGSGSVRSVMYHPMGVHGTISVGATEPGAFDETDQQVLALLATSAAAACTRAKRESEVREAREHTETVLDRVNGLIENTVEVLVQATTREELAEGVVGELAAAEPYSFAWLGQPDVASETLAPSTWAGEGDVPAGDLEFDLAGESAVARAYRSGESQVVQDIAARVDDLPHGAAVLGEDVRAGIVIPLVYKETTYGVVAVFADEAGAFDERERVVLDALGRAVANAVNAIERGRIMDATEIIELEFTVSDPDVLFCRLSRDADCRVEAAGTDYRPDGSLRLYLTAEGGDGERLAALAREDASVTEVNLIADHEGEALLELTVEDSLLATLTEFGAVPREVVGEEGRTRFTVELPYESEAREVFDLVEGRYPSTDLVGYHERERPVETRQEFRAALFDRFTDRQETALRTAYLGGFFEWPRDIDGNELAEAMDISRPTYHQHLRAAQRKVLEELFE